MPTATKRKMMIMYSMWNFTVFVSGVLAETGLKARISIRLWLYSILVTLCHWCWSMSFNDSTWTTSMHKKSDAAFEPFVLAVLETFYSHRNLVSVYLIKYVFLRIFWNKIRFKNFWKRFCKCFIKLMFKITGYTIALTAVGNYNIFFLFNIKPISCLKCVPVFSHYMKSRRKRH